MKAANADSPSSAWAPRPRSRRPTRSSTRASPTWSRSPARRSPTPTCPQAARGRGPAEHPPLHPPEPGMPGPRQPRTAGVLHRQPHRRPRAGAAAATPVATPALARRRRRPGGHARRGRARRATATRRAVRAGPRARRTAAAGPRSARSRQHRPAAAGPDARPRRRRCRRAARRRGDRRHHPRHRGGRGRRRDRGRRPARTSLAIGRAWVGGLPRGHRRRFAAVADPPALGRRIAVVDADGTAYASGIVLSLLDAATVSVTVVTAVRDALPPCRQRLRPTAPARDPRRHGRFDVGSQHVAESGRRAGSRSATRSPACASCSMGSTPRRDRAPRVRPARRDCRHRPASIGDAFAPRTIDAAIFDAVEVAYAAAGYEDIRAADVNDSARSRGQRSGPPCWVSAPVRCPSEAPR